MKNPELVQETREKICNELNAIGFTAYGEVFNPADGSMKELAERHLVQDPNIYGFLVQKNLIHFDFCLLCGEHLTKANIYNFTLFGRYYNMCSDCYETSVPAHKKQKEGCYIATVCYGSYDHPDILIFRAFRDNTLVKTPLGRQFINSYYKNSPQIAIWLQSRHSINSIIRIGVLKPMVIIIKTIGVIFKK